MAEWEIKEGGRWCRLWEDGWFVLSRTPDDDESGFCCWLSTPAEHVAVALFLEKVAARLRQGVTCGQKGDAL